jgi:O-acetyl-ADP-ribose deacetylase (regulator of RNase III)
MAIHTVSGDLFVNRYGARALAQGVNCQGSMGAGIAVGIRERYPAMYAEYRRRCIAQPRELNPGEVFLWRADDRQPWVFNLATQENYWHSRATYAAVERALRQTRALAEAEAVRSIAAPRIGAGYGGLSWKKLAPIFSAIFADWPGDFYLYETYVPEDEAQI